MTLTSARSKQIAAGWGLRDANGGDEEKEKPNNRWIRVFIFSATAVAQ